MTRKYYFIGILLTAGVFGAILIAYPQLPSQIRRTGTCKARPTITVPSGRFSWSPRVDGWDPAAVLFFCPGCPETLGSNTFQSTYLYIMVVLVSMLAYFAGVSLWVGLGYAANVDRAIIGGVCLLFALLGNVMGKVRRQFSTSGSELPGVS